MLGHDFKDMPGRSTEIGDNPHETVMLLRCTFCMKTPFKARQDGCPIRELQEKGIILLSEFNPGGVAYFHGRVCVTCGGPIMGHFLKKGSDHYWCYASQYSEGINDCVHEVDGIVVPQEAQEPKNVGDNDVSVVPPVNN